MDNNKVVTLMMHYNFRIKDGCITWIGGSDCIVDKDGNCLDMNDYPSKIDLLIHMLGKMVEGKNGLDELAIVNSLKEEK